MRGEDYEGAKVKRGTAIRFTVGQQSVGLAALGKMGMVEQVRSCY